MNQIHRCSNVIEHLKLPPPIHVVHRESDPNVIEHLKLPPPIHVVHRESDPSMFKCH